MVDRLIFKQIFKFSHIISRKELLLKMLHLIIVREVLLLPRCQAAQAFSLDISAETLFEKESLTILYETV